MKPKFSILIPAIFERLDSLKKLVSELESQAKVHPVGTVEILSVIDNRIVTIGEKRQVVLSASTGDYVAFVDDDDWIEPTYVRDILEAICEQPDAVTFDNLSFIEDHAPVVISMRLKSPNEQVQFPGGAKRAAWHTCAWRSELAKSAAFPASNYGEDWAWARQLNNLASTEFHIDKVLHHYIYKQAVSRAVG